MKNILLILLFCLSLELLAQQKAELSVSKIMQDPKTWVGTSPGNPYWSEDSKTIYFTWNPEANPDDSLYRITAPWQKPEKVTQTEQRNMPARNGVYNKARTKKLYAKNGDLFIYDIKSANEIRLTTTSSYESSPYFSKDEKSVLYTSSNNLFRWNLSNGTVAQLTNFSSGEKRGSEKQSEQDAWLEKDELALINVLREDKENRELRRAFNEKYEENVIPEINIGKKQVGNIQLSPNEDFITYTLSTRAQGKRTIVPDYVTESSYTEDINARTKVGSPLSTMEVGIYNVKTGKNYMVKYDNLPGIDKAPEYYEEYERTLEGKKDVFTHSPTWSEDGSKAVISFRSTDNKDRWIALLNPENGEVNVVDHQHDAAWIAGPGIGWMFGYGTLGWMPDDQHIYFQSEESGYSHLYKLDSKTGLKTALTSGSYEIYNPRMSRDKLSWYFEANRQHPGVVQFFKMPMYGGEIKALTEMGGKAEAILSPDEKSMAIMHSKSNIPTELYVSALGKKSSVPVRITNSTTSEWNSYAWREPEFITFEARDGAEVHARLYKGESAKSNGAAVVFVHGAGYLQNAHQWWSSYFREYMFHNFLVDNGYTVLDIDYRGSAGYGRDWRTGIYQHMGGFDLTDQVDGAKFLVNSHDIDPERIGLYGGSYGGFITLMAMFTEQETFAAGAALRSVTDWAHYNHGYTSNILNTPVLDSLAYRKSSPIYYAEGLKGALLICHGMVDTNVHFQDVVRLAQRLIELGKENWEFAVFPKESHGFVHPSSWTDEYSRIFKLFEENLK